MQTATVRLVRPPKPDGRIARASSDETYRPLVIGCVNMVRTARAGSEWLVRVRRNGWLWPAAWPLGGVAGPVGPGGSRGFTTRLNHHGGKHRQSHTIQRLALGLLCGADLRLLGRERPAVQLQHCDADIYGWSLLYQPQRLGGPAGGLAAVDTNPDIPELPAFYESPLELCDRLDFLDRRGVPARPLALVTRPEDFVGVAPQRPGYSPPRLNRFIPDGLFQPPADLSQLPGG